MAKNEFPVENPITQIRFLRKPLARIARSVRVDELGFAIFPTD